jgi:hypothetical protein
MFATPYEENDAIPDSLHGDGSANLRVLVPDSDNDDSLGFQPTTQMCGATPTTTTIPPRAFSKRAAKCAAALLQQHETTSCAARKERCMQQLRRLGGAYRPLGQGQSPVVWVRYADLNARVIRETEAYFDGRLNDRLATPQVSRRNGSLRASTKSAVQFSNAATQRVPCGIRTPLPCASERGPSPADGPDKFALSRGEQCALSLLSEDNGDLATKNRQSTPTYLLRKDEHGVLQRVSVPSSALSVDGFGGGGGAAIIPGAFTPLQHCWVYGEDDDGLSSIQTSPSAAHSTESPGAAVAPRKRSRTADGVTARRSAPPTVSAAVRRLSFEGDCCESLSRCSVDDDEVSVQNCSGVSSVVGTPKSLSATIIERQNHRMQWSLLRQQSLFSPF